MMKEYFITVVNREDNILPIDIFKANDNINITPYKASEGIDLSSYSCTEKMNPLVYRVSNPIEMETFIVGADSMLYEVVEGVYKVSEDDTFLNLKVRNKYER